MTRTRRRSRREWFGIMDNGRSVGEIYNLCVIYNPCVIACCVAIQIQTV